ncbi:MAG: hypothetical protein RL660_1158 [Bacteroidota bacterium]|jgi:hypothetical protein
MHSEEHFYAIRIRNKRRRIRDSKTHKAKQLIQLGKQQQALRTIQQHLGYEALETPYQKGFKRFFVLSEQVISDKEKCLYEELLPWVNTIQYSLRHDFKKKKRVKRKRVFVDTIQELKTYYAYQFYKVPDHLQRFFVPVLYCSRNRYSIELRFTFSEPWRYKLCVAPHMITHRKIVDTELATTIKQLDNMIDTKCLRPKIDKARSKRYQYKNGIKYIKHSEIQVPIQQLLKNNNE